MGYEVCSVRGIFDTPHDKPAHWEFDTFGGWLGAQQVIQ